VLNQWGIVWVAPLGTPPPTTYLGPGLFAKRGPVGPGDRDGIEWHQVEVTHAGVTFLLARVRQACEEIHPCECPCCYHHHPHRP
jgi:hypothetical protein